MKKRTEVYTISGFLNNKEPIRIEGGISPVVKKVAIGTAITTVAIIEASTVLSSIPFGHATIYAATAHQTVATSGYGISKEFDRDIWPLFIDIGKPIAKVMMALGIYQIMRNSDKGWKTVQRAGIGLVLLYMIDVGINLLTGIGMNMDQSVVEEMNKS